jgi:hypothetical protein
MGDYTQNMTGNRSFPERPNPSNKPSLNVVPQKGKGPDGSYGEQFKGYGEQGDGIEVNDQAPAGNKRPLNGGKFVQQQMHQGTDLNGVSPAETSIRNIRLADLGPEFGRGPLDGSVELAGEKRSLPKKFLPGGRAV